MSKRVSIVLPDEMPLGLAKSEEAPKSKANLKSSMRAGPSIKSDLVPPVFVFVSPEISASSEASSPRPTYSSPSGMSLNNWMHRDSSTGGSLDAESPAENWTMVRSGSSNNNLQASCSSIKQFLRSTVALVRAGESFTSVKHLFYNFIKSSSYSSHSSPSEEELSSRRVTSSPTASQLVRRENPYLSESNDTITSNNNSPQLTIPCPSQMTTCTQRSSYSSNPLKYEMSTSWLSDVSPLTGYTPYSTELSHKEAGYQSDVSLKTYASVQAQAKSQDTTSIQTQQKSQEDVLVDSTLMPAEGGLSCCTSEKDLSLGQSQGGDIKTLPELPETLNLLSDAWQTNNVRRSGGSSNRSLPHIKKHTRKSSPWRSPKMSPRRQAPKTAASEPTISAPETHSQDNRSARSSESSQRSSRLTERQAEKKTPQVSPRNSVTSGMSQKVVEVLDMEPSSQIEQICRSSEPTGPERSSQMSRRVNFLFTIVSPEEGGPSQPENSTEKDIEERSTCVTYQEECKCHHCQDMRRAVRRVEYFQSPEGQKRMESKLLAKNFFMDLCALSKVRKEIQADLYGTRKHPSSRVSYPVSICGACRLDGGSLTLNWFTHDLDCVDHFEFFVDDKRSKSVFNKRATSTVLIDVNASTEHRLKMRAVPVRGCGPQDSPVDKLMSEVAAGHMRNVRQGQLFASCLKFLDAQPQRSLVDFWTDSEFLYLPTCDPSCPGQKGR
ncbi:hypothetical protein KR059_001783 [Drosophila kikkawai]|nr:hypothetical protein KR059_001783 [Drosophila kikkawai]